MGSAPLSANVVTLLVDREDELHIRAATPDSWTLTRAVNSREVVRLVPESPCWDALIIDSRADREAALQLLADLRARGCTTPALLLLDGDDREAARAAHRCQALATPAPPSPEVLQTFFAEVARQPADGLRAFVHRHGLTPLQGAIVLRLLRGQTRQAIAHALGLKPDTVRTHMERLGRRWNVRPGQALADFLAREIEQAAGTGMAQADARDS